MAVSGVVVRAQRAEVEVKHARDVRAVDQRLDAASRQLDDQLAHRVDECRRRGDVIEEHEPCPRAHRGQDARTHIARRRTRKRDLHHDGTGAGALGSRFEGVPGGVVAVVGHEQLVARREGQTPQHRIDRRGGIRHECEVLGIGSQEGRQRGTGSIQVSLELLREESDRVRLHARAPAALCLEHGARRGSERAVVQEDDGRVEGPGRGELGRHQALS